MQLLRIAALAGLMLTLVSANLSAQGVDKPTAVLEAVGNTIGVLEIVWTESCVQQLTCVEGNPIHPDGTSAAAGAGRALIKGSGMAVSSWLLLRWSAKRPQDRKWIRVASIGKIAFNGWLAARALDYHNGGRRPAGVR